VERGKPTHYVECGILSPPVADKENFIKKLFIVVDKRALRFYNVKSER